MKGLFIKDIKYLIGQKRFFITVLGFGLFLSISAENPVSAIGYITMLITIFTLSTISYDEYENGMAFLMTLPISRDIYAMEKYLFAGTMAVVSVIVASLMAVFTAKVMNMTFIMKELLATGGIMMIFSWLVLAVTIPMQIKYGAERVRMVMLLIGGGTLGVMLLLSKAKEYLGMDLYFVAEEVLAMNKWILIMIGVVVFLVVMFASYCWCVRIMKKKEF